MVDKLADCVSGGRAICGYLSEFEEWDGRPSYDLKAFWRLWELH